MEGTPIEVDWQIEATIRWKQWRRLMGSSFSFIKRGFKVLLAISWRGDGSAMRSLLFLTILYVLSIEYSAEALTVPRMRKREISPTYWSSNEDQPAYELSHTFPNLWFSKIFFCFFSFYNSLEDLKSLENDDEYDYKWDRYDGSWDNVVEYPSPRYQKRSYHGQVDAFKRAKAAREWYTRLG